MVLKGKVYRPDSVIADVIRSRARLNKTHKQRETVARQIYSAIPGLFGLRFLHGATTTQFVSDRCIIRFGWERYESKLSSTQFFDPTDYDEANGMSFWILQHVIGFQIAVRNGANPYYELGMAITTHCDALLQGEFDIRQKYDALENRILDRMSDVRALPPDDPIRKLFDSWDIRWLTEIEASG